MSNICTVARKRYDRFWLFFILILVGIFVLGVDVEKIHWSVRIGFAAAGAVAYSTFVLHPLHFDRFKRQEEINEKLSEEIDTLQDEIKTLKRALSATHIKHEM